jgi:hypothetical protein
MLTIKLTPMEADFVFPWDEENEVPAGHDEKGVQELLKEVAANAGPMEIKPCTSWEYFGMEETIYKDQHGDECLLVARCKMGEETIEFVCVF